LPRGISSGSSVPEAAKIGFEQFTQAVEHARRLVRGKAADFHRAYDGDYINYHEATISYDFGRKVVRILCSACYPVIAFALPRESRETGRINFTDCPMLANVIGEKLDCAVLFASDAHRQPAPSVTDALDENELRYLAYWKPQRIGDVVFNQWD